jgi:hypothetical protein
VRPSLDRLDAAVAGKSRCGAGQCRRGRAGSTALLRLAKRQRRSRRRCACSATKKPAASKRREGSKRKSRSSLSSLLLGTKLRSPWARLAACCSVVKAITPGAPTTRPLLVRRSHDAGADPGDERFPNRTNPATPGPSRRAAGSAQVAERRDQETTPGSPCCLRKSRLRPFLPGDLAWRPLSVAVVVG